MFISKIVKGYRESLVKEAARLSER